MKYVLRPIVHLLHLFASPADQAQSPDLERFLHDLSREGVHFVSGDRPSATLHTLVFLGPTLN